MKKYLGEASQFLQPKNRLERAIQDYVKTLDRVLIYESDLEEVKIQIKNKIAGIVLDHAKCTPIRVNWWTPAREFTAEIKDWVLGGCDCVRFVFLCSKESEKSRQG